MRNTLFLIIACALLACQDRNLPKEPARLLSHEQMANILYYTAILNAAKGFNKREFEETGIRPEAYIYEKNDVDSLTFKQNSDYYVAQLKEYKKILTMVQVRLQKLSDSLALLPDDTQLIELDRDRLPQETKPVNLDNFQTNKTRNRLAMPDTTGIKPVEQLLNGDEGQ